MISSNPNPKMFLIRTPEGKKYNIPEHNLDKAISLGGEIIEDKNISSVPQINPLIQEDSSTVNRENPIQNNIPLQDSEVLQQSQPQQKIYRVRTPQGKLYNIPEQNLKKAQELGGVIEENPIHNEYEGENQTAAFAKNVGAGALGAIPDTLIGVANLTTHSGRPSVDPFTGEQFPAAEPLPFVTDSISNAIDKATSGYTKDTGAKSKHAARFLGSLFGAGYTGKLLQTIGAAGKAGAASQTLEKIGSGVSKLGVNPSVGNATGALASGASVGFSEENELPIYYQLPLAIGTFVLGHNVGNTGSSMVKNSSQLQSLFDSIPGLQQVINKGHYKDLAKNVSSDSIKDLMKMSLIENESQFLSQKVLSELPEEIVKKIQNNPKMLNDSEIKTVIDKGLKDYNEYIINLEKEYFPLTTGEFTGSPKIIAKEDSLANKPNVDVFDKSMSNRRYKMSRSVEKIKDKLSTDDVSSESLGETIAKEVNNIYSEAYKIRRENWIKNFGDASDQNILSIEGYINKLKEFSKLRPDNEGNIVAIKAANKKLKDGILFEKKISPKRFNDILVGLNEDIRRFPDKTFSQKQVFELKKILEDDLTKSIENAATSDQASVIRNSRSAFAEDSKILDQIDESILFSKINKDSLTVPEKIAQSLDNMPASQLRLTLDALKRSENYQDILPNIQSYYLDRAFKAATKNGLNEFNARIFLDKLPNKKEFDIIFGGSDAYKEIKDISILLDRVKKFQSSRSNSKTAQRAQADRGDLEEAAEMAVNVSNGEFISLLKNLLGRLTSGAYDKRISELLISPEHRKGVLKELNNPRNNKIKAVSLRSLSSSTNDSEKNK